jgi:pyrroloquinoline quinone (PQQ) biosynthesis protein C
MTIREMRRAKLAVSLRKELEALHASISLKAIASGKVKPEYIWQAFGQYLHYCGSFPQLLNIIISRTTSPIARQPLVENLREESGSGFGGKSHALMLEHFLASWACAAGIDPLKRPEIRPAVGSFVDDILSYLQSASLPAAFGFLGPGTEEVTSEQYKMILEGLRSYRLVNEKDLEFFSAHITADVRHADTFWTALEQIVETEDDWNEVYTGARYSLVRETKFWNELAGEV